MISDELFEKRLPSSMPLRLAVAQDHANVLGKKDLASSVY